MGKGEIARYEQFLLFPQCFQKTCFSEASKGVIVWEWVNPYTSEFKFLSPIHKHISNGKILLDGFSLIQINIGEAESVEQDQTARMCSLILLYTLRKINPR